MQGEGVLHKLHKFAQATSKNMHKLSLILHKLDLETCTSF
jgi:hypothetical protein